ncbi:MAG: hypothetical protein J7457_09560 [Roseiflexus sp.]|nr:hypothetical protein [Roseiflexus sp.]
MTVDDGLAGNMVHALLVTPDGMLWVATKRRVELVRPNRMEDQAVSIRLRKRRIADQR